MEMLMTPFYFIIFIEKQSLDEEAEGAVVAWGLGPFRMFCVVYSLFLLTDPPPPPFLFHLISLVTLRHQSYLC